MITEDVGSYDDLFEKVDDEGGIATIRMEMLRKLNESERLGSTVVATISSELSDVGLGHYPETLPTNKSKIVLLFARKTNFAKVLDSLSDIQEDTDEDIRDVTEASANDAKKRIAQIKKILAA